MLRRLTEADWDAEVVQAPHPCLVVFSADWCPACRHFYPDLERLAEQYQGKALVGVVAAQQERRLSREHRVSSIPQAVLYHRGRLVTRYRPGAVSLYRLISDLDELLEAREPASSELPDSGGEP